MRLDDAVCYETSPTDYASTFVLSPVFVNPATMVPYNFDPLNQLAGPCYLTDLSPIVQRADGNGVCLVLFDTTTLPAERAAMFTGDANDVQPKRIFPLTGGNQCPPIYSPVQLYKGCVLVMSTSWTALTYATPATLFSFQYAQSSIGYKAVP